MFHLSEFFTYQNENIVFFHKGVRISEDARICVLYYIYTFVDKKKFESYLSDLLTFSNICSRTSLEFKD